MVRRGDVDERKSMKEKERKHSGESRESGRRILHIHLPSSSGLFRWRGRKIAAGVLYLSFSCSSPHSVFLSSFTLSAGLFRFFIQFVMYREGFPCACVRIMHIRCRIIECLRAAHILLAFIGMLTHTSTHIHECSHTHVFMKTYTWRCLCVNKCIL